MANILDLQTRIEAAVARIDKGLEGVSANGRAEAEIAKLTAALEEERSASAQLEERVLSIQAKQTGTVDVLSADVERLRAQLATVEETMARLAKVNAALRTNNAGLREAMSKGVAEPHLINTSMQAELEALRSVQAADRAELDAVLGEINALVAETNTTDGEAAHA